MKKQILTFGTAILFIVGTSVFTGCSNSESEQDETHEHADGESHDHDSGESHEHNEGEAHEHGNGDAVDMNTEFTGEKVQDLSLILDSYLQLKNALAIDNSTGAAEAAQGLLVAFNGFDNSGLDDTQKSEYSEIEESAVENAEHITKNIDVIDHQREHLVVLSEDMNDLITLVGTDRKLYKDFCPMADNNNGAIWISETEEISNPYMGSKMPTCGKVQEEIN
jgi:uncharacterized protein DUF3347